MKRTWSDCQRVIRGVEDLGHVTVTAEVHCYKRPLLQVNAPTFYILAS